MTECACGCGEEVSPGRTYVQYHHLPELHEMMSGETSPLWKGGRLVGKNYVLVRAEGHPRAADKGHYVHEHVLVAEEAFGRKLPDHAVIHHVNGDGHDNRPANLVICEGHAYHNLLHRRQRALEECGHADWRICAVCHQYDDPANLKFYGTNIIHRECNNRRMREYKAQRRAESNTQETE